MITVTGATGQLGHLVIEALLKTTPAAEITAAVRSPEKAADLAALGVNVKAADYTKPETLEAAFEGTDRLLLISSSEVGQRAPQHQNVIDAAKKAGVKLLAYPSILRADATPLGLGEEHRATEAALAASGLNYVLLRNGWYTENYAASIPSALEYGVFLGAAGEGRISSAARADYAAAAAAVLTSDGHEGKTYELSGDDSYTLAEFAAEIAKQSGKEVIYQNMAEKDFNDALIAAGLPDGIAAMLADSDAGAEKGGLFDEGKTLSSLTGQPTTPYTEVIAAALKA
ncbi:MAG: NAD(P)-dependent oxidoreductase [Oleibacter sp.]|nr:NAD(P)-dependent oxidoreductase [Thalassolituus sp.]